MCIKDEKHAKMITEYIKFIKLKREEFGLEEWEFETEVPYNYYGDRGYVDLIVIEKNKFDFGYHKKYLFEFKTEIRDVGEMLRQFKRMKKYYPKTDDDMSEYSFNIFVLVNDKNINTILDNIEYIGEKFIKLYMLFFNMEKETVKSYHNKINKKVNSVCDTCE